MTSAACPNCEEPLPERPERCFRCEAPLGAWWRLDAALDGLGASRTAVEVVDTPKRAVASSSPRRLRWLAAGAVLGFALGLLLFSSPVPRPEPAATVAPEPVPAASRAAAAVVPPRPFFRYRVQRGDSAWRIAAALVGRGDAWPRLWPTGAPVLVAGQIVELDVVRLEQAQPPGTR